MYGFKTGLRLYRFKRLLISGGMDTINDYIRPHESKVIKYRLQRESGNIKGAVE